jgi:hypothetical protein
MKARYRKKIKQMEKSISDIKYKIARGGILDVHFGAQACGLLEQAMRELIYKSGCEGCDNYYKSCSKCEYSDRKGGIDGWMSQEAKENDKESK